MEPKEQEEEFNMKEHADKLTSPLNAKRRKEVFVKYEGDKPKGFETNKDFGFYNGDYQFPVKDKKVKFCVQDKKNILKTKWGQ